MKQKKWNIILIVLFVLLTASILWLLVVQYTKSMVENTSFMHRYNKAYYIAQWALEDGLTKVATNGIGFESDVSDIAIAECVDSEICEQSGAIVAQSASLQNTGPEWASSCDEQSAYVLEPGQILPFPLFWFDESGRQQNITDISADLDMIWISGAGDIKATILVSKTVNDEINIETTTNEFGMNEWDKENIWEGMNTWLIGTFDTKKTQQYLLLHLVEDNWEEEVQENISFCLQSEQELPTTWVSVYGVGTIGDVTVSLQSDQWVQLPWFLFNTSLASQ